MDYHVTLKVLDMLPIALIDLFASHGVRHDYQLPRSARTPSRAEHTRSPVRSTKSGKS